MDPADRAPTMAEHGQAMLFGRACRITAGNGETIEELRARAKAASVPPPVATAPASTGRKLKMTSIASQVDDSEFDMAPESELLLCFRRYESIFGRGERPGQDQEPTPEQVSAIRCILSRGQPPFVDFGVFGPHGHRIMKKVKLSGYTIGRDGQLQSIELLGPTNIAMWEACYNFLMNALVMLDAVDLGALMTYKQHIIKLHDRYSARIWPVIYQADNRCRLEHMERTRRSLQSLHEEAVSRGSTTDYDDARPWNIVFRKVVTDETFWRDQVVEPALLVLTKVAGIGEMVQGDAGVGNVHPAAGPRETEPRPARMSQPSQQLGIRPRNNNRTGRYHQTEAGKYTANRTGYSLCSAYNSGECEDAVNGQWCPRSSNCVHQCFKCLGSHPGSRCPHSELQVPGFIKNKGKKGKGGGNKGKGKSGKGWQPYWPEVAPELENDGDVPDRAESPDVNVTACSSGMTYDPQQQNSTNDAILMAKAPKFTSLGKVLYLFSGPARHQDGVQSCLEALGIPCKCMDTEISPDHNLLDQSVWDELWKVLDDYEARLLSPPCGTFSAARRSTDGGPMPLRSSEGPGRYGLANLRPEEKEKVRVGNVLAIRSSRVCKRSHLSKKPWILEQPHHRISQGKTSMFNLDEFVELMGLDGVYKYTFDQCMFGAMWEKATDLLSNIPGLVQFELRCNHHKRSWTIPWSGEVVWAAHPPLKGRQLAIPSEEWGPHLLTKFEPKGEYLTRKAAAYPSALNQALADALAAAMSKSVTIVPKLGEGEDDNDQDVHMHEGDDRKVVFTLPLKGPKLNEEKIDDKYSLRNIHKSMDHKNLYIGKQVANLIERRLDSDDGIQDRILDNLGKPIDEIDMPEDWLQGLRSDIRDLLVRNRSDSMPATCETSAVDSPQYQTVIRAELLKYWAETVQDPGSPVAGWLINGAPAGLSCDMSVLDPICPSVDAEELEVCANDLFTEFDSFQNYSGVDDDSDATKALLTYRDKGYIKEFDTLEQLRRFVGAEPVLSKLGCIKKTKYNADTGAYTTKNRIILDCKESAVSRAAKRTHKSILPRVSDAVHSALALMSDLKEGEQLTMLITDIIDAFWLVPLRVDERRYFCAKLKGKYYAFLRTAQGSRGAPLTFAAVIALAGRLVQSMLAGPELHRHAHQESRMQIYVDDPLTIIRGNAARTKRLAALSIVGWTVLGFPLAFHKAVMAPTLTWVGVKLQLTSDQVRVEVPESKVQELLTLIDGCLSSNLTSKKSLRTLIGKAMAVASVLYTWRPFLHELYAALHCKESNAPTGCVWTKQLRHSLQWIKCFLSEEEGHIVRVFTVQHYLHQGPQVIITWDASPFGMGATLQIDGEFTEFFAVGITDSDCDILQIEVGSSKSQQTVEALAGLIAMRVWSRFWQGQRAVLQIRSDNIGALSLFAFLRSSSAALRTIAAEFALDLGRAEFRPDLYAHIPGITNVICDVLSRRYDPRKTFYIPSQLLKVRAIVPPTRNRSWWRSLSHTSAAPSAECEVRAKRQRKSWTHAAAKCKVSRHFASCCSPSPFFLLS